MFKTRINAHTYPKSYERNTKPSVTVPDQTLTIPQIIQRFTSGRPVPTNGEPLYFGELVPNLKVDLIDLQEQKQAIQNQIDSLVQHAKRTAKKMNEKAKELATPPPNEETELEV